MKKFLFFLTISIIISCKKDRPVGPQNVDNNNNDTIKTTLDTVYKGVFIINEGNFSWGNGSISFYNPKKKYVENNIFKKKNSRPLGDVVQSMTVINQKGYIVVNNSQKIEVVNINDFKSINTIYGLNSPRYILPVSNDKLYVTDLYDNAISIIDISTNSIIKKIKTSGWTENLLASNNKVYVCNVKKGNLLIINPYTDTIQDSITLSAGAKYIVKDSTGYLWVLCDGDLGTDYPALYKITPVYDTIVNKLSFPDINSSPSNLCINKFGNKLFYLNNDVFAMDIFSNQLPLVPVINNNNKLFYALGIDPTNDDIYVSDAVDYVQEGIILRYDKNYTLLDSFKVGIIPGAFVFFE